jgi:hypothetical protein
MSSKKHTGGVPSKYSDEEIMSAYNEYGSREAARQLGMQDISGRVRRIKERSAQDDLLADSGTREEKHRFRGGNSIQELYDNHAVVPDNVIMTGARIAEHGVVITDKKTGAQRLDVSYLKSSSFKPKEECPKWPVIQPANAGTILYAARAASPTPAAQRVFLWPDTQIGFYRSVQTGELTPMHDLAAVDVALQMLHSFRADRVVILGDLLDLAGLSRWLQLAEFQHTLQPALQYTYILLAKIRSIVGANCVIDYLAGNHERRMSEYIAKNAIAAHGIRNVEKDLTKVNPHTLLPTTWDWPALSIPKLLHLEDLGIKYSAEYPGGEVWLNDRNVCTHPPEKSTRKEIRANVYHGHIPRATVDTVTVHNRHDSPEFSMVAVPGLMGCGDITDKSSLSRTQTTSSGSRMNWQQGVGTLLIFDEYHEAFEIGRIKNGWGSLGGQQFFAEGAKHD